MTGRVASILHVAEGFHEKRIGRLADEIAARLPATRLVCVAGPSSSGKTTFLKRLSVQLQVMGIRPVGLSLDDYYVDRALTPRDERETTTSKALEALDLPQLASDLGRVLRGETVRTARYDFQKGVSVREGGPEVRLDARDVLLLEGIHGLNPKLLTGTGRRGLRAARVHHADDLAPVRLPLARQPLGHAPPAVVRDRHGRNHDAAATILRWPSVRAGERRHIFPYFERADVVFDTSLIYEVSVLKVYAERYLLEVPPASPAYATAFRLRQLIDRFVAIHAEHCPHVHRARVHRRQQLRVLTPCAPLAPTPGCRPEAFVPLCADTQVSPRGARPPSNRHPGVARRRLDPLAAPFELRFCVPDRDFGERPWR